MRHVRTHASLAAFAAGLVLGSLPGPWAGASASENGKQLYVKHGCWQCHGFVGQGGVAGPALAPNVMPLEAMLNFVRSPPRAMPPYREAILSKEDMVDIHAYLVTIPKPGDYKSVPLLNQ